jgi:hypothetical protein
MSSSEDDFMSDKYLVEPPAKKPTHQTYAQRRSLAAKKHLESQPKPRAVREEEARRKALETSLFERGEEQGVGAGKAMGLMMKMGWKPGEGLGKRAEEPQEKIRARSPEGSEDDDDDPPHAGIGSKRRKLSPTRQTQRTEPLRISMWAGKSGLGTHQRSPSPENMSFLLRQTADPTNSKGPGKELDFSADEFRRRRAGVDEVKRIEGRQWAARKLLMEFDQDKGIQVRPLPPQYKSLLNTSQFHPLWIIPSAPLQTIPRPLIRLIDPETADTLPDEPDPALTIRGGSPGANLSAADRMREEMRRDALAEVSDDEDVPRTEGKDREEKEPEPQVDWESFIPSVHRVLRMDVSTLPPHSSPN